MGRRDPLKGLLKSRGLSTAVGDEGGFAPDLPSNEAAIETILAVFENAGFQRDPHQAQPDRHPDGNPGGDRARRASRIRIGGVAPVGRD
jgi:hypothetical protein